MLCRVSLMAQVAVLNGESLDPFSPFNDGRVPPEVDVGGRDVAEALVVALVVIMVDDPLTLLID